MKEFDQFLNTNGRFIISLIIFKLIRIYFARISTNNLFVPKDDRKV